MFESSRDEALKIDCFENRENEDATAPLYTSWSGYVCTRCDAPGVPQNSVYDDDGGFLCARI